MKWIFFTTLFLTSLNVAAKQAESTLLAQFHNMGITRCDEFILKNTANRTFGWKFFLSKHASGIDGPNVEVSMTQISGKLGNTNKTDYSFIQGLKKCFVHKRGLITTIQSCTKAVNTHEWRVQYNLPKFDYKRYKNVEGVILYTKEIQIQGQKVCLLEYEFRSKSEHTLAN